MLSFARVPELSSLLIDFDRANMPCFFGFVALRVDDSTWSGWSVDMLEPARWSERTISERLSVGVSKLV